MNRRNFLCGIGCILTGFALSELRHLNIYKQNGNEHTESIPSFSISMASHCNMKCKGCDAFSTLAEEEFVTYNQLIKDITKLKELYDNSDYCDIGYVGGEPLLNPEFKKIIKKVHEIVPRGTKRILTNGSLLNSMDDEFWKYAKKYITDFAITKYPINIDRTIYENNAQKHDVRLRYDFVKSNKLYDITTKKPLNEEYNQNGFAWSKNILDLTGSQDYVFKRYNCPHRGITTYARGNLYYCYIHAHINSFAKYFNVNIPITKDDYLKIEDVKTKEEIQNFLDSPKPLCRFCKQCHNTCYGGAPLEWDFSKFEITEWT